MKFTKKGIIWLILGALMCFSATEAGGMAEATGTILFGLVFVSVYLIKQRFDPRGIGWYVVGGILLAFSVECLLDLAGGAYSASPGEPEDVVISVIVAAVCLFIFYLRNKRELDEVADEMGLDGFPDDMEYQQEVFRETEDEASAETAADDGEEVVFEIESEPEDSADTD